MLLIIAGCFAMAFGLLESATLDILCLTMISPLPFLVAIWGGDNGILRSGQRILARLLKVGKKSYLTVDHPLVVAAMAIRLDVRNARVAAMILPLPRIVDLNLTPRLLPVPRAHMGALI